MTFVPNTATNTSSNAPVVTPSGSIHTRVNGQDTTISGYLIQQGGQANGGKPELTLTTGSSASAGIMLGANGEGNLYLNFLELTPDDTNGNDNNWGDPSKTQIRKMILDLSNATNTQYSLVGNIIVDAGRAHKVYGENAFEATFGKGMKGDLTLRANVLNTDYRNDLISKIIFLDGSGIDGNVVINAGQSPSTVNSIGGTHVPYGGNNLVFRQNGSGSIGEISGTLTVSGGYTRLYHEATNVAFSTAMVLRGGTLVFDNYKNIETALADDTLNNSNITSNTLTLLNLDQSEISGGSITFNEYNQIIFGSDGSGTFTIAPKTIKTPTSEDPDATTTYSGGSASFIFGSSVTPNNSGNPIIKGNIDITKGNVIFALSNTSNISGSNPFTDPSATHPENTYYVNGNISVTDGGISAFWDDTLGFYGKVATTNGKSFSVNGGLIGKNDIWFADAQSISSIQATSDVSHLVFDQTATIGTLPVSGDPLSDAILARSGDAMILFKGQATINGNIKSSPNRNTTIIAKQGITLNGSISALAGQGTTYNRFDLAGAIVFNNSAISAVSDTRSAGDFKKYNILKFTGNVSGTITDLTSFVSLEEMQNNYSSRANNVLSFESNEAQSLSITTINGQITNGKQNGFNYIGKGLTTGEQNNLTLNSSIFSNGTWRNSSHTANLSLTTDVIQTVNGYSSSSYGSNYINVKDLTNTGSITTNGGGDNNISIYETAELAEIRINVGSGNNRIYTYGTTSIGGDIIMESKNRNDSNSTNFLILTGTSVALGENNSKIRVKINNVANSGGAGTSGQNTILLGGNTTNTVNISELSVVGDWGGRPNPIPRTFNMLSFKTTSNNKGSIDSISSRYGSNIIGKDLIDQNGTYNTTLFGNGNPTIQSGFVAEFVKDKYSANGSFVIGDNSGSDITDAITTSREGTNYINIKGSTTIKGNILSSNQELNGQKHNNLIVLTGTSATLGESSKEISIRIDNSSVCGWKYSNNTLLFGATTNRLYLSMIGVSGDYGDSLVNPRTFNALSFNSSNNVVQGNATVSAVFGNNIIAKNLITQDGGYNSDLFRSVDNVYTMQDAFATVFMADTYQASGTFALGDITNSNGGGNYINVETLTVAGDMSSSGAGNYIKANNFSISGNITSSTNNTISTVTWTNTESGAVVATGSGINNITAKSGNATFAGISTKDYNASSSGNTINFESGSITINTRSGDSDSDINGKALYAKNGSNNNTITAGTILVNGEIYANSEATNSLTASSITVNGDIYANSSASNSLAASSSIAVTGNIGGGATNNFTLTADDASLTLKGANSSITTLTASTNATTSGDTLILDASTNDSVNATINTLTNGDKLNVDFKGIDGSKSTKLTLNTANATDLKTVSVTSGTNNTLALGGTGTTEVAEAVTIGANKGLIFDLSSGSSVTFGGNLTTQATGTTSFNLGGTNTITGTLINSGIHNYNVGATSTTLKYGGSGLAFASGENNINFNTDNATLNWQNTSSASQNIATSGTATTNINFNSTNGTLATGINTTAGTTTINIANGKSGTIQGNIAGSGNNIVFASGNGASALALDNASGTYAISSLNVDGANKSLSIANGKATITNTVDIARGNEITFNLSSGTELELTNGSDARVSASGSKGAITLSLADSATATISGGDAKITNLDFNGTASQTLNVKSSNATFGTLIANNTAGSILNLDASSSAVTATINTISGENLAVQLAGSSTTNKATLNLNGGTIKSIQVSGGNATDLKQNVINFASGTTTITDAINKTAVNAKRLTLNLNGGNLILTNNIDVTNDSGTGKVDVSIENATLTLNGVANKVDSLSGNGGIIEFVGANAKASTRASSARKTLTTNTFSGNLNAVVFVSEAKADQIIVTDTKSSGTLTISAQGDINEILSITQDNGVVVAKVGSNSNVKVQGGESVVGGIVLDLVVNPDKSGNGDYLIGKSITKGVDRSIQTEVNTALAINYDLFLANFNSLNKRMGELRDNPHSQGVWARVFGGAMSSEFGAGSKTEYVTAQAGYDYSLTLGNANNYMGIAIAYGKSWTKANEGIGLTTSSLSDINSNMVEVGIYNSYVMDSGWYNDTIFKFDYIMSDFTLNAGGNVSDNNTNNFAMVLSDEFGYRYKFAENEKGNWYIDPQVEVAFGYFNQSDLNHTLKSNIVMTATQDAILNLRTRAGLSLGKKFNTAKGFASLYVGAFYEYDYIEGGNSGVTLSGGISGNQLDNLESNGRAIVNVGSNIELTEGVRMYIDVEKSFGDKQRTDMQFNFGARYSFGEATPTLSHHEQYKAISAPLKVDGLKDHKDDKESKNDTEESKNTEKEDSKSK